MAYTNKIPAAVAIAVLFLAVTIAPRWTEAQSFSKLNPVCALIVPEISQLCYLTGSVIPSEDCCKSLKSASSMQVDCLCDNFIAHPSNATLTRALFDAVHSACGVQDKFACKDASGGAMNKFAASMGLFGFVASLFL
ncbi:unnamed protein product [Microthlaspi erraticum]|uniref:Bifunctional inhibitor/plant lipid transfer protein/seed storage helical domain-containing protein n=1 Tax=Microthlaspi erraticum TaxID=1685480 RepID=A0A6D2LG36_9BRAS|nr:unnamed protein product [Microthlaspi erraticum]